MEADSHRCRPPAPRGCGLSRSQGRRLQSSNLAARHRDAARFVVTKATISWALQALGFPGWDTCLATEPPTRGGLGVGNRTALGTAESQKAAQQEVRHLDASYTEPPETTERRSSSRVLFRARVCKLLSPGGSICGARTPSYHKNQRRP